MVFGESWFDTLPLLVRPGAVVPVNGQLKDSEGDVLDGLEVMTNDPEEDWEFELVEAKDVTKVGKEFTVGQDLKVHGLDVTVMDMTK